MRHVNGMTGMSESQALNSFRGFIIGLPETIDGTCGVPEPEYKAKQLAEWQDLLDEVREYLADGASPEARDFIAAEQARIDGLR